MICLGRTILSCVGNGLKIVDFRSSYIDISYTKMILGLIPTFWVTGVLVEEHFSTPFLRCVFLIAYIGNQLIPHTRIIYKESSWGQLRLFRFLGFWSTNTFRRLFTSRRDCLMSKEKESRLKGCGYFFLLDIFVTTTNISGNHYKCNF